MYDSRKDERKKEKPDIPAEKQRLAASLFGGSKGANGVRGSKAAAGNLRPGEKGTASRPAAKEQAPAKAAPAPLMDLMDMSEGDSFPAAAPAAKPAYDPFMDLSGLVDGPSSTVAPSGAAAPQKSSSVDFMSLFDSTPTPSSGASTNDADFLSLGLGSSSSMGTESVSSGSQGGLMDLNEFPGSSPLAQSRSSTASVMKGPSVKDSLQKDVKSRQVGVTPTGANPALFQDLL